MQIAEMFQTPATQSAKVPAAEVSGADQALTATDFAALMSEGAQNDEHGLTPGAAFVLEGVKVNHSEPDG